MFLGLLYRCGFFPRNFCLCWLSLWLLCLVPDRSAATVGGSLQMLLGNPSGATADSNNHDHYLIQRDFQALDYSDQLRQVNWASWHYTSGDSGSSGRSDAFAADTNLPPNFYWVQATDYSGSGYDRGHMCPSADRTDTVAHNVDTFRMSNMIPQAPDNNQGLWANLETYSRAIAASNEVLVICGPQGFGSARTASTGAIPIASNVWKIIVAVPLGSGSTLSRITNSTRVIAVHIPNIQGIRNDPWQNYRTSVNQLQTNTGFTFFTALNSNLATVLRAKIDGTPACGLTNFAPLSGASGTSVILRGTNFTGVTAVWFNGTPATFSVNSANQITATVPPAATTGPIAVVAAGGLATRSTFTVTTTQLTIVPTRLEIALLGDNVLLSWPTNAAGYVLQQATNASAPEWITPSSPATVTGTNYTVTVPIIAPRQLFRLSHP